MDDLIRTLKQHQGFDPIEEGYLLQMQELARRGEATFCRTYFEPGHFTASLYVVHPDQQQLLLHHHRRYDLWLPVGGHIEAGETPAHAAMREGREESGLDDLEFLSPNILAVDIHSISGHNEEPGHFHFDIRFAGTTQTPDAIKFDPTESKSITWVSLDDAERLMHAEPGCLRAVAHLRELLQRPRAMPR